MYRLDRLVVPLYTIAAAVNAAVAYNDAIYSQATWKDSVSVAVAVVSIVAAIRER